MTGKSGQCELADLAIELEWPPCSGYIQLHHIINKGKLVKAKKAKKFVEKTHPEIFFAEVCMAHNVGRFADTGRARRELFRKRCETFGVEYVRSILDELQTHFKIPRPELSSRALLD